MEIANDNKKPMLADYGNIRDEWCSKDRVTKLLGIFSSKRLFADWKVTKPDDSKRGKKTWQYFVTTMREHYKPLKVFGAHESFPIFCNRVYKGAQHCNFKCHNEDCTAKDTAIRDQIIIGTTHEK